jgi:hypothetical protein
MKLHRIQFETTNVDVDGDIFVDEKWENAKF